MILLNLLAVNFKKSKRAVDKHFSVDNSAVFFVRNRIVKLDFKTQLNDSYF